MREAGELRTPNFGFGVNPVRRPSTFQREGSHGALNPVFAPKGILSSSPLQAARLSNGVKQCLVSVCPKF